MMAGRYAHSKQFKRHQRQLRTLSSRLGRIIRDMRRKIEGQASLEGAFTLLLGRAAQIRSQQQRQRGWKLYSFHAPRGGVHQQGQGCRALRGRGESLHRHQQPPGARRPFVLDARALPDNPCDGHTLRDIIDHTETLTGCAIERSSGPMSTRDTATTRKIPIASSSPARSAASSVSSNESCAAAPPSSPSSGT